MKLQITQSRIMPILTDKAFQHIEQVHGVKIRYLQETKTITQKRQTIMVLGNKEDVRGVRELLEPVRNLIDLKDMPVCPTVETLHEQTV